MARVTNWDLMDPIRISSLDGMVSRHSGIPRARLDTTKEISYLAKLELTKILNLINIYLFTLKKDMAINFGALPVRNVLLASLRKWRRQRTF